uniref:Odorant receptor 46a-like n=1 Tax=Diabrotica virgifera virgifera TaxID=50390 RepID=A0A6P7G8Q2_DIAVI
MFSSVREQSLQALHLPRYFEMLHDEENKAFENDMYHRLCKCTAHLQLLFKVRDTIEETFCLVILAQTLSSLLILGSCLYNATMVPLTSIEFFVQMMFFVCVLVQFSLLCWYGSEVTSAVRQ